MLFQNTCLCPFSVAITEYHRLDNLLAQSSITVGIQEHGASIIVRAFLLGHGKGHYMTSERAILPGLCNKITLVIIHETMT